jgi:hypothetical protein
MPARMQPPGEPTVLHLLIAEEQGRAVGKYIVGTGNEKPQGYEPP